MLAKLLGSEYAERVLIFLIAREEGYARQMADFYDVDLYGIQVQLGKFEAAGLLYSRQVGRTVLYAFNPRYPLLKEVNGMLSKALSLYPDADQERLLMDRRRPRRRGKPN